MLAIEAKNKNKMPRMACVWNQHFQKIQDNSMFPIIALRNAWCILRPHIQRTKAREPTSVQTL